MVVLPGLVMCLCVFLPVSVHCGVPDFLPGLVCGRQEPSEAPRQVPWLSPDLLFGEGILQGMCCWRERKGSEGALRYHFLGLF